MQLDKTADVHVNCMLVPTKDEHVDCMAYAESYHFNLMLQSFVDARA